MRRVACLAASALPLAALAQQPSAEDMNAANNPLAPTIGANLQDQYVGRSYGTGDEDNNAVLLRGTLPHKLFGMPQILRATLPVVTTPHIAPDGGRYTGAGDLNLFDVFLFKAGGVELGFGPQLTIPLATRDQTGTGKWQAGFAAIAMAPQKWGLLGGLVTWQKSFAGDGDRLPQNNLSAQPFLLYNLPEAGTCAVRQPGISTCAMGTTPFRLASGPARSGSRARPTTSSPEPQWTVARQGDGQPKFQVFMGLNLQFPL